MKKTIHSKIILFLISMMLGLIMVSGIVSATLYVNEDFEDEDNNANPESNWYTYSEYGFTVSNVSNANAYSGSQAFYLNDSANDRTSYANFTFNIVTYYDWFYLRFQIPDVTWHNSTNISFIDDSSQILGYVTITNTTMFFNNSASNIANTSITNDSWYRIYIDFNLTTEDIGCYIYNESDSGTLMASGWGDIEDGTGTYSNVAYVRFTADTGTKTSIWIDDFRRAYTYINPNQAVNNAVLSAITTLLVIAIILVIITYALTGAITPTQLISIAVISVIGVITAMIITGI